MYEGRKQKQSQDSMEQRLYARMKSSNHVNVMSRDKMMGRLEDEVEKIKYKMDDISILRDQVKELTEKLDEVTKRANELAPKNEMPQERIIISKVPKKKKSENIWDMSLNNL